MVRALPHDSDSRIDFGRVAAIAAAIALHAAALLMLLMPMAAPQIAAVARPKLTIQWYPRVEPVVEETAPVVEERTVTPQRETPTVVRRETAVTPAPADTPVIVDGGSEPVVERAVADAGDIAGPVDAGPLASATLEYVKAPAPRYPASELRKGAEGTVLLRILVDVDGTPIDVQIEASSGNRVLDKEARQHVLRTWRFKPALRDGVAVQAYGLVPIAFSMQ